MTSIDRSAVLKLLNNGPDRTLVGGKQLTLAFGGLYIASTTLKAKPLLVWEADSGYARYYVPTEALHSSIVKKISDGASKTSGDGPDVTLEKVDEIKGDKDAAAVIEKVTIGSKSTAWVRFTEGNLKDLVRFEAKDMGEQ